VRWQQQCEEKSFWVHPAWIQPANSRLWDECGTTRPPPLHTTVSHAPFKPEQFFVEISSWIKHSLSNSTLLSHLNHWKCHNFHYEINKNSFSQIIFVEILKLCKWFLRFTYMILVSNCLEISNLGSYWTSVWQNMIKSIISHEIMIKHLFVQPK
jgi:hypothetical protein